MVRLPIYAAANKGLFRRILNYSSFWLSATAVGPFAAERPDVVIGTSPQFLTAVAARWLAWAKRAPFVFEVRDLWPRSIVEVGAMKAGSPVIRSLEKIELFLYRHADHIVPVTESFVSEIAAHGVPLEKLSVVTNGVDLELFRPRPRDDSAERRSDLPEGLLVAYAGTHGMAHGLDLVLEVAKRLPEVRFLLVGEGAEKTRLKDRAGGEAHRQSAVSGSGAARPAGAGVCRLRRCASCCCATCRSSAP